VRRNPLTLALLAVALVVVGAGAGYLVAGLVDDDGSPRAVDTGDGDGTTTTAAGGGSGAGTGPRVVVSRLGVIGWWQDGHWVGPTDGTPPVAGGETYQLIGLDGPHGTAVGGPVSTTCEVSEPYPAFVELDPDFEEASEPFRIGVTGVAEPLPRRAEELDGSSATYRAAARDALATVGIHDGNPRITQLLRVDLEGDGSDEVLMTVGRTISDDLLKVKEHDYSALVLRRVTDGEVHADVLEHHEATSEGSDFDFPFLVVHGVAAVADLNGDGDLEIVTLSQYYEGAGVEIYDRPGDRFEVVASTGCGV
jgi:hypothetical protein